MKVKGDGKFGTTCPPPPPPSQKHTLQHTARILSMLKEPTFESTVSDKSVETLSLLRVCFYILQNAKLHSLHKTSHLPPNNAVCFAPQN